jgi:hypothetical protein
VSVRFPLVLVTIVGALCLLLVQGAQAQQAAHEHVTMSPAEGTLATPFVFRGTGYQPNVTVSIRFLAPDGLERRMRTGEGAEIVLPVQADGTFLLDVVLAQRFPGAPPGQWRVLFCADESPTCELLEFHVAP